MLNSKSFCCFFFVAFLLLANAGTAHCHPHAFVTTTYTIVFDDQGIHAIEVNWVFDEMYSATTAADFDTNEDGTFGKSEREELVRIGKEVLPASNFFTHIKIDGKPYPVESVKDLTVSYEDGLLRYNFFVGCQVSASENWRKLQVSPYNKDFFFAMFFHKDLPFTLENSQLYTVKAEVGKDKETLIYFDSMHPSALNLEFQKKAQP